MSSRSSAWGVGLLVISAWGLAFSLAAHLTSTHSEPGPAAGLADWLLGESRQALSLNLFNEADLYFHKGVAHRETAIQIPGPFRRWQADITPVQHAHAEGDASAEILPWLKLATRADPHNVEAFLVASYWAQAGLHRQDLAGDILNEAQRMNPGDYRIALEKGRLAIVSHRFNAAIPLLESALTLQTHTAATPDRIRELTLDRAEILTFLGFLKEANRERPEAIRCFRAALALFPERVSLKERITLLEGGHLPQESAQRQLEQLTRRTVEDTCKDEDHDPDHAGHPHAEAPATGHHD